MDDPYRATVPVQECEQTVGTYFANAVLRVTGHIARAVEGSGVRGAAGWTRLAGIALELTALAFVAHVVMQGEQQGTRTLSMRPAPPDTPVEHAPAQHAPAQHEVPDAAAFVMDANDGGARYYRAASHDTQLLAAFYSDGRVRLADSQHRFAGMLQGNHADLLDLASNQWSEVFVHVTPEGGTQLELRGGPYDSRMLTCEALRHAQALRLAQDDRV